MQDRPNTDANETTNAVSNPLRGLSEQQFAALGGDSVVFVRRISADDLARLVPQAAMAPQQDEFHLVVAANGAPLMVSDTMGAVDEWIADHDMERAPLH